MSFMTASDAAWFRMNRPRNEADIVALLELDGPLPVEEVRRIVEDRLLRIPRFRERPVPRRVGPPSWEPDPSFSLDRHVVRAPLAAGGLRELVGRITTAELEPGHPPWCVYVVDEGGRGALVAKLQHAMGDGFALVAVLAGLADAPPGRPAARAAQPATPARPAPDTAPPSPPRSQVPPTAGGPARRRLGLGSARDAGRLALALARLALLRSDPPDLAAVTHSGVRHVAWTSGLPYRELRQAARRRGGTLNDLLVAAVAGGLRAYLAGEGRLGARRPRAFVPVNLRARPPDVAAGEPPGNEFGLVYLDLPVDVPSAVARFAEVRSAVLALRSGTDPVLTRAVLAACGWLPTPAHHLLTRFFSRKASLVLTSVPGPRERLRLGGRVIRSAMFWVPHPASLALGVSILSYAGEVRVGVRADAAVVPDPVALAGRIEAEALALAGLGPDAIAIATAERERERERERDHDHDHERDRDRDRDHERDRDRDRDQDPDREPTETAPAHAPAANVPLAGSPAVIRPAEMVTRTEGPDLPHG